MAAQADEIAWEHEAEELSSTIGQDAHARRPALHQQSRFGDRRTFDQKLVTRLLSTWFAKRYAQGRNRRSIERGKVGKSL